MRLAPTVERWSDTTGYRALVGRPAIASILLVKADHIGDFILSFDALASIRRDFPAARIDLVCAPWNEELALALGLFGQVFTLAMFGKRADSERQPGFDPASAAGFRARRYDLAVDLRVDVDTRVILRHVTATYKVGFDAPEHRDAMTAFLPHYLPPQSDTNIGMHQSLLMLRLARTVADLFAGGDEAQAGSDQARQGTRADPVEALLRERVAQPHGIDLSPAEGRFLVLCNSSSGRVAKNWPAERFRRLVRWMAQDLGCAVLLMGAPDQCQEAAETIAFCGSPLVFSAVGRTSMREAVGLVAQASLFIGNDSALTHVAARLGVPTVALFSGIDPTVMWASRGPATTVLRAPVPCSPCHILHLRDCRGEHACMRNISESAVRAAVRRHLFAARRHGRDASPGPGLPDAALPDPLAPICDQVAAERIPGDVAALGAGGPGFGAGTLLAGLAGRTGARAWLLEDGAADALRAIPAGTRLCLAHVDCAATAAGETAASFYARLVPGGFLVLAGRGAARAARALLADKAEWPMNLPDGSVALRRAGMAEAAPRPGARHPAPPIPAHGSD